MEQRPVCLSIGGSDSCAGAGIQADLRVFESLGMRGCSAITALTAQNPARISRIEAVSLTQFDAELRAVFDYFDVRAVKTGMLVDAGHIAVAVTAIQQCYAHKTLVIDPVMVASSGAELLDKGGRNAMIMALIPMATLITPNLDEAGILLGRKITDPRVDAYNLAVRLGVPVLLKGGHGEGDVVRDVLAYPDGETTDWNHPRLVMDDEAAHGTGCRLAAAITACLAGGNGLKQAVKSAIEKNF